MKRRVAILGTGATKNPGTSHICSSFKELLVKSSYQAINDAGINPNDIEAASFSYSGESEVGHGGIAPTLIDALGLAPIPGFVSCANCTSGHVAFVQGYNLVASGKYDVVLVAGFDKATDVIPFQDYMLLSSDSLYDYNLGFSHFDSVFLQKEYFDTYNISKNVQRAAFLKYAKMARENASKNPIALGYKKHIPKDEQLEKMPFCGNLMTTGEGSAALILMSEEKARSIKNNPVYIEDYCYVNTSHYVGHQYDLDWDTERKNEDFFMGRPLQYACNKIYKECEITPKDIGTLQVYDQGVNTFVSIEAAGLCDIGEGVNYILEGKGDIDGECPLNTDGGNIGRGFAGGTAGLYPIIEIVKQLNGTAEGVKIEHPITYGLSTFVGGGFAHAIAILLSNKKE